MSFIESPALPDSIALEAEGGPTFSTTVVQMRSGRTQSNEEWQYPLHAYQISLENKEDAFIEELFAFFYAVAKGRLHKFRMRDWAPGQSSFTDAQIGTGNGAQTVFQLMKIYTIGSSTFSRLIAKPRAGSVTIALNGAPTTAFTLDATTGLVTMASPPANTVVVTASCATFDVPVEFVSDKMPLRSVQGPSAYSWPTIQLLETRTLV